MTTSDEKLDAVIAPIATLTKAWSSVTTSQRGSSTVPSGPGSKSTEQGTAKTGDGNGGPINCQNATSASLHDGDDANLVIDPRVTAHRQALKRSSIALPGLLPPVDANGQPTNTALAQPVANYSLKEPELSKEGHNVED
jgi:hypothetical protein